MFVPRICTLKSLANGILLLLKKKKKVLSHSFYILEPTDCVRNLGGSKGNPNGGFEEICPRRAMCVGKGCWVTDLSAFDMGSVVAGKD